MFGGHNHSGSGDIKISVCHMTLQDNIIRALCNFIVRSSSRQVAVLSKFVTISTVMMEI